MKALKLYLVSVIVLGAFVFSQGAKAAKWWPGIIHAHSNIKSDDGWTSPEDQKEMTIRVGCFFLIPTKHYNNRKESTDYFTQFSDGSLISGTNQNLIVLPGFECSTNNTKPNEKKGINFGDILSGKKIDLISVVTDAIGDAKADKGKKGVSHTLAIGEVGRFSGQEQKGNVPDLLNQLKANNLLTISAHPNNNLLGNWNFVFQKENANAVNGVEFFNETDAEMVKTRDWYFDLLGQGRDIFVTSGCDTHGPKNPLDLASWTHITCVYTQEDVLTRANLLQALQLGRTIATNDGVFMDKLNHLPGFAWKRVNEIKFSFRLNFAFPLNKTKKIRIWCGKDLISESEQTIAVGQKTFDYEWKAKGIYPGANNYVIEIENCLITSPIRLITGDEPAPVGPNSPIATNSDLPSSSTEPEPDYTGGMPILFGKSFNEVAEIMGSLPFKTSQNEPSQYFFWQYRFWPREPYVFSLSFSPYDVNDRKAERKMYFEACYYEGYYAPGNWLKPAQIVPKEILALEPSDYAWIYGTKIELVVIWYRFNRTFVLVVSDSRRPVYDLVKGINENGEIIHTPKMNANSRDFRNADQVINFTAIDRYVDCYNYPKGALEKISDPDNAFGKISGVDGLRTYLKFGKF